MGKKITQLATITEVADNDFIVGVDVSDTSGSDNGTNKKFTKEDLLTEVTEAIANRVTLDGEETVENKTLEGCTIDADDNTFSGMLDWFYPVGTLYETTSTDLDTTTKMGSHFGGTWEVYGEGKVTVAKSADTEFDTIGETGGAKDVTLTSAQSGVPAHSHTVSAFGVRSEAPGYGGWIANVGGTGTSLYSANAATNNSTAANAASAHNNLQPYIVVYRYRRTA